VAFDRDLVAVGAEEFGLVVEGCDCYRVGEAAHVGRRRHHKSQVVVEVGFDVEMSYVHVVLLVVRLARALASAVAAFVGPLASGVAFS
jgi:hypothetical protein